MPKLKDTEAFTLIELLVVLVIVALLAAVAIPRFNDMATKAKISAAEQELDLSVQGLFYYKTENDSSSFPPTSLITSYEDLRQVVAEYIGWLPTEADAAYTFTSYAGADTGFTLSAKAKDADRTVLVATHLGITHP